MADDVERINRRIARLQKQLELRQLNKIQPRKENVDPNQNPAQEVGLSVQTPNRPSTSGDQRRPTVSSDVATRSQLQSGDLAPRSQLQLGDVAKAEPTVDDDSDSSIILPTQINDPTNFIDDIPQMSPPSSKMDLDLVEKEENLRPFKFPTPPSYLVFGESVYFSLPREYTGLKLECARTQAILNNEFGSQRGRQRRASKQKSQPSNQSSENLIDFLPSSQNLDQQGRSAKRKTRRDKSSKSRKKSRRSDQSVSKTIDLSGDSGDDFEVLDKSVFSSSKKSRTQNPDSGLSKNKAGPLQTEQLPSPRIKSKDFLKDSPMKPDEVFFSSQSPLSKSTSKRRYKRRSSLEKRRRAKLESLVQNSNSKLKQVTNSDTRVKSIKTEQNSKTEENNIEDHQKETKLSKVDVKESNKRFLEDLEHEASEFQTNLVKMQLIEEPRTNSQDYTSQRSKENDIDPVAPKNRIESNFEEDRSCSKQNELVTENEESLRRSEDVSSHHSDQVNLNDTEENKKFRKTANAGGKERKVTTSGECRSDFEPELILKQKEIEEDGNDMKNLVETEIDQKLEGESKPFANEFNSLNIVEHCNSETTLEHKAVERDHTDPEPLVETENNPKSDDDLDFYANAFNCSFPLNGVEFEENRNSETTLEHKAKEKNNSDPKPLVETGANQKSEDVAEFYADEFNCSFPLNGVELEENFKSKMTLDHVVIEEGKNDPRKVIEIKEKQKSEDNLELFAIEFNKSFSTNSVDSEDNRELKMTLNHKPIEEGNKDLVETKENQKSDDDLEHFAKEFNKSFPGNSVEFEEKQNPETTLEHIKHESNKNYPRSFAETETNPKSNDNLEAYEDELNDSFPLNSVELESENPKTLHDYNSKEKATNNSSPEKETKHSEVSPKVDVKQKISESTINCDIVEQQDREKVSDDDKEMEDASESLLRPFNLLVRNSKSSLHKKQNSEQCTIDICWFDEPLNTEDKVTNDDSDVNHKQQQEPMVKEKNELISASNTTQKICLGDDLNEDVKNVCHNVKNAGHDVKYAGHNVKNVCHDVINASQDDKDFPDYIDPNFNTMDLIGLHQISKSVDLSKHLFGQGSLLEFLFIKELDVICAVLEYSVLFFKLEQSLDLSLHLIQKFDRQSGDRSQSQLLLFWSKSREVCCVSLKSFVCRTIDGVASVQEFSYGFRLNLGTGRATETVQRQILILKERKVVENLQCIKVSDTSAIVCYYLPSIGISRLHLLHYTSDFSVKIEAQHLSSVKGVIDQLLSLKGSFYEFCMKQDSSLQHLSISISHEKIGKLVQLRRTDVKNETKIIGIYKDNNGSTVYDVQPASQVIQRYKLQQDHQNKMPILLSERSLVESVIPIDHHTFLTITSRNATFYDISIDVNYPTVLMSFILAAQ